MYGMRWRHYVVLVTMRIEFSLHGLAGTVAVEHQINDDPAAVGFGLLGLDFEPDEPTGFPVIEANVQYEGRGYKACMGWLQVVRYTAPEDGDVFMVDTAPQFRGIEGLDFPFVTWGVRPTLFDAPATGKASVDWWADAFLVASPDALMTPTIQPLCAFRWGYQVDHDGTVTSRPPQVRDTATAWAEVRDQVQTLHPAWKLR
jgi:hypothetical protein